MRALPRTPGCSLKYCLLNQCSPLYFVASCQDLLSRKRAKLLSYKGEESKFLNSGQFRRTFAGHVRHICTQPQVRACAEVGMFCPYHHLHAGMTVASNYWREPALPRKWKKKKKKTQRGHRLPKDRKNIKCT